MANVETEVASLINEIILDNAKYRIPGNPYHELEAGGLTPEYIWIPEVDTEELWVRSCKILAEMLLRFLRDGTETNSSSYLLMSLSSLRKELEAGNLTLEDIGTSEAEIDELRVRSCKTSATMWLRFLRDDTNLVGAESRRNFINFLREELKSGNLTLEDIGTSEAEIENFRKISTYP